MTRSIKTKVYLVALLARRQFLTKKFSCPSCGSHQFKFVVRKKLLLTLRRCKSCNLLYSNPRFTPEELFHFYQEEYQQGLTTEMPGDELLADYVRTEFKGTEHDYIRYINIISAAGGKQGDRLFDFGCSWGYGGWQFTKKGYQVESFEISQPRAEYARRKFGLTVHSSLEEVKGSFDIFFSGHVLEHVPSVRESIEFGMKLLKPNGLFVAFTPNGSEEYMKKNYQSWNSSWGINHPNLLDDKFYEKYFSGRKFLISSMPSKIENIKSFFGDSQTRSIKLNLAGGELLLLVKK